MCERLLNMGSCADFIIEQGLCYVDGETEILLNPSCAGFESFAERAFWGSSGFVTIRLWLLCAPAPPIRQIRHLVNGDLQG